MRNLKNILAIATFLLIAQFSFAQHGIGAKASLQYSSMDLGGYGSESILNTDYVTNFSTGIVYHTELGSGFFFRPEMLFSRKGFDSRLTTDVDVFGDFGLEVGVGVVSELNMVSIPLNLGYSIDLGKAKLQIFGGPTVDYSATANLRPYGTVLGFRAYLPTQTIDLQNSMYNRFELGGTLGAGLAIPVKTGDIILDGRVNKSFTNFLDDTILDINMTNKSYAFGIGYMHRL